MMKAFYLILLLVAGFAVKAQKTEDFDKEIRNISTMEERAHQSLFAAGRLSAGPSNFDVKYYRCEWEVDPTIRHIKGKVTVYYKMLVQAQSISLDLMEPLTVSQVTQRADLLAFNHTDHVVDISFPAPVAADVLDSVSIFYEGVPPNVAAGSFTVTTHGSTLSPVLWSLSEPYGSRDWWPCKNGLDDKADSLDVFITHPAIYKAASNGLLQSELPKNGKIVTYWKHKYPIASYLVCLAVSNYSVFNNSVMIGATNVPVQTYCYPESLAAFQAGTQNVLDAMVLYSNLFGNYPFENEKYGHVQFGYPGGMEHQTSTFLSNAGETLVVHELGHHWFGDKITCASWEDIWLNEGFATHLSNIYRENKYPANKVAMRTSQINQITSQPGGSVKVDNVNSVNRIFDNRLSYLKGSHLLYMLRWILGDADFFDAVRNYQQDPALAFGYANTANLKAHLEAVSGKDLTYFFDQWFTGQGYPSYQVEWSQVGNNVKVKLSQTTSHASVSFFRLPVPLLFTKASTGDHKLLIFNNVSSGESFVENIGFEADAVSFDPEYWLVSRNNSVIKVSPPLPVVFTSFTATCDGTRKRIMWSTSQEQNASHFEVQRSKNGTDWTRIGVVDAFGESVSEKRYAFLDSDYTPGKTYYRVAEVDTDGKIQLTRIVATDCEASGDNWFISPNPLKDELTIQTPSDMPDVITGQVSDVSGKWVVDVLLKKESDGRYSCRACTITLPVGLYLLRIENSSISQKFVKQ